MSKARTTRRAGTGGSPSTAPIGRLRLRLRRRRITHRWAIAGAALAGLALGQFAGPLPGFAPFIPWTAAPQPADPLADSTVTRTADSPGPGPDEPVAAAANEPVATPADGERAVALMRPPALPPLIPGDRVELVAVSVDDLGAVSVEPLDVPVQVIALDEDVLTVAIPAEGVGTLLGHQARGSIEVVALP